MDIVYQISPVHITFEDSFPYPGEEREVILADKSEWKIQVLELTELDWMLENGKVIGAVGKMKYRFIEEVRPSSEGKLRLV